MTSSSALVVVGAACSSRRPATTSRCASRLAALGCDVANMPRAVRPGRARVPSRRCRYPAGPRARSRSSVLRPRALPWARRPLDEALPDARFRPPRESAHSWLRAHPCAAARDARPLRRGAGRSLARAARRAGGTRAVQRRCSRRLQGYDIEIELLAGDHARPLSRRASESCRLREELGRWAELSTTARGPRRSLCALGRLRRGRAAGQRGRRARSRRRRRPPRCSGGRRRAGCSPSAASTRRRSGSPARRSRSARRTEDLERQGRNPRRPWRRLRARRSSGRRRGRERGGARPLRSQGELRACEADARATRRAPS